MNTERRPWWSASGAGILRLLLVVFIGGWALAAVVYAGELINRSWLTPSERRAGVEALKDVDALRNSSALDDGARDALIQKAEAAVAKTGKVAFTLRDHWVSGMLSTDLHLVKVQQKLQRTRQHAAGEGARKLQLLTPIETLGADSDERLRRILGVSR
jgi:hypothetical protein